MSTGNPKLVRAWHNEATGEYFSPKVRMLYPTLIEPKVNQRYPQGGPKFSVTGLVPKAANIDVLKEAVAKFAKELYGESWSSPELAVKLPIKQTKFFEKLKDYAEEYPFFIRTGANPEYPPSLFGPDLKPAKREATEIYGGRWAIFAMNVWGPKPENKNVNRFVNLGLQRVQLLDHDDVLSTGRIATADGFEAADFGGRGGGSSGGDGSADALWQ